jgi:hypothetical protein
MYYNIFFFIKYKILYIIMSFNDGIFVYNISGSVVTLKAPVSSTIANATISSSVTNL